MTSFPDLIQQGNAWLFLPSALLLGALHGLEPGHSKTVMTAFIVAVKGTIKQAVLLGLSAAFSHSLIVWVLAGAGIFLGRNWATEATEPYFQLASAVLVLGIAFWMLWSTYRGRRKAVTHPHGEGDGPHGGVLIDTGHEQTEISVFETGMPPHFRLYFYGHNAKPIRPNPASTLDIETIRAGDIRQKFSFVSKGDFLESTTEIPEPHEFTASLTVSHGGHHHSFQKQFTEDHHSHEGIDLGDPDYQDAHQRAHAEGIQKRFASRTVTTGQVVLFGLTGGLIPCSAAITVLLLCLQTHRPVMGFVLVMGFSAGLAATMVASGVLAAWGMKHASKRLPGFSGLVQKAPYISSALVIGLGIYMAFQALIQIHAH
ncbi:MAG: sulfite exporter TauE/SafE family protein [Fibrobacteria bacterium]